MIIPNQILLLGGLGFLALALFIYTSKHKQKQPNKKTNLEVTIFKNGDGAPEVKDKPNPHSFSLK